MEVSLRSNRNGKEDSGFQEKKSMQGELDVIPL